MKSFEEEELWLDDIAESLGLNQGNRRADSENIGQSDDACEEGQILPKKWKNEEETKSSLQDPGHADDVWEEGQILPIGWKSKEEIKNYLQEPGQSNNI